MRLRIHVVDAAYIDKRSSDNIMFELVPRYDVDEQSTASPNSKPSWLSTPCVRQSDMLFVLYQHLQRKHPHFLLPPFPTSDRHCPGWGGEAHLQLQKRRLERFFQRLLGKSVLQEDVALHDFMTSKGEQREQKGGIWSSFGRWFKNSSFNIGSTVKQDVTLTVPEDKIIIYKPINIIVDEDKMHLHEATDKSLGLRKSSLQAVSIAVSSTIQAIQKYSESLGRLSKTFHEITAAHVQYLVLDDERRRPSPPNREITSIGNISRYNDDIKGTERRFRELGDRFIDLVNQLQPGLTQVSLVAATSVLEVLGDQKTELGHVRSYVNKEIHSMKRYDHAATKRIEASSKSLPPESKPEQLARHITMIETLREEESKAKAEYEEKSSKLPSEMDFYWDQTSREIFTSISQVIASSIQVGNVHADVLKAWFPPDL